MQHVVFVCNDTVKETVVRIIHLFSYRWHVLLAVSGPFTAAEEGLELIKVCCPAETVAFAAALILRQFSSTVTVS